MAILFRGGLVFDGEKLEKTNLLIEDGIITKIDPTLNQVPGVTRIMQLSGCLVAPGFTDLHVHLRQPGYEYKETIKTGTMAAMAGGFTTVCAMPNVKPVPDNLHNLEIQCELIQKDGEIRVLPYGSITVGQQGKCLSDIEVLAPFVAGFTDDGFGVQNEHTMKKAMEQAALAGSMIAAHCENTSLLPSNGVCAQENCWFTKAKGFTGYSSESEWSEVERNIRLAEETGCRLHICHLSTEKGFELVRQAKAKGLPVTCEVTPHNLVLNCEDIDQDDGRFKMNPPLRTRNDMIAAQKALLDGTIDAIATDHAPHTQEEKSGGFAKSMNGIVGLETAFPVLYTKLVCTDKLSLEKLLQLFTSGPRKVLKETPNSISVGQIADFTVIDLDASRQVDPDLFLSKGHSTPFLGWTLKGWPMMTVYKGDIVWEGLYRRYLNQADDE